MMNTQKSDQPTCKSKQTLQITKPQAKKQVSPLRQRMISDMELAGYTPGTQQAYISAVVKLQDHYKIRPDMNQQRRREQTLADCLLEDAIDGAFDEFQTARHDDTEAWQQALRRCLERLPQRAHSVLKARFVDEMSYQQIAKRLGMTLEAVRKSLFRYKKQVRSCVETSLRGAQ